MVLSQANAPAEDTPIPGRDIVAPQSLVTSHGNSRDQEIELDATDLVPVDRGSSALDSPVDLVPVDRNSPALDSPADVAAVAEVAEQQTEFHPPLALQPEYARLHLTVKRGDTLDRLFRRNKLSIGDLTMMLKLPDAAPHLKKVIPGDELTIEHDEGALISLYRELDLTSALKSCERNLRFFRRTHRSPDRGSQETCVRTH